MTNLIQPGIQHEHNSWQIDKLTIADIPGAQTDVHKKLKFIQGSDANLNTAEIDGAFPRPLKQNHSAKKVDIMNVDDITERREH